MTPEELKTHYKGASDKRNASTNIILASSSAKKVVVAGPGTGKTTLFKKVLEKTNTARGSSLTLSFINALVDDLSLGLYGLSDVKTLHGFSAGILQREASAKIFPKLAELIRQDAVILLGEPKENFEQIFQGGTADESLLAFYKERKDYYGRYYGFSDAIYALVKYFEQDPARIPEFKQIVVDEFQDFNQTEVTLIELLASRSPIMLAGDDDQSLYVELKDASPDHIRRKRSNDSPEYESFSLPFCSRSTEVVVGAANDVIKNAIENELLNGRVSKPYDYFPCEKKDAESQINARIVYAQYYEGEMATLIQKQICEAAERERDQFNVLIVMPPQLKNISMPKLAKALKKKGFKNISYADKKQDREPTLIEGLKILLGAKNDNLGWRIIAKRLLSADEFDAVLRLALKDKNFSELLTREVRHDVTEMLTLLRRIRDGKEDEVDQEELGQFMDRIGYEPYSGIAEEIRHEVLADDTSDRLAPRAVRGIPITITTVPSSKGLSGDYVFITHFDDQYYTDKGRVTDREVFSFLVALTRAKKKAILISSKDIKPIMLSWIDASRIDEHLDAPHTKRKV